jgi:hypothetical protein
MKLLASALMAGGLVLGGSGVITLTEPDPAQPEPKRETVEPRPQVWERMSGDLAVWVAQTQQGFEQHLIGCQGLAATH